MPQISAHKATARLAVQLTDTSYTEVYYPLEIEQATVTLDEAWSPYAQGTVQIKMPVPAVAKLIDPRKKVRVQIEMTQEFGDSDPISALTAQFPGAISTISAYYSGTLADITPEHYRPYNSGPVIPSSGRYFNLLVREVVFNRSENTATLTLSSDEALLQDYRLTDFVLYQPGGTAVRALAELALNRIMATIAPGAPNGIVAADATGWLPGVSGWDWLSPMLQATALRLWCDERRVWRLTVPRIPEGGPTPVLQVTPLASTSDKITRDGDWFDAAVVVYTWTDAAGIPRRQVDAATRPNWSKARLIEQTSPYPGAGAAEQAVQFSMARGHTIDYASISDYNTTPGWLLPIVIDGLEENMAVITAVTWNAGDNTMRIATRDLSITGI